MLHKYWFFSHYIFCLQLHLHHPQIQWLLDLVKNGVLEQLGSLFPINTRASIARPRMALSLPCTK